jgi:hypothetical protein
MRSGQRFSYLALEPEETRALNAAYHQRIHRDQSNLIPLDPEAFIQKALALLASERYLEKGMGLMALTGRRPAEIFFSAKFSLPRKKLPYPAVIFDGQLKTRKAPGTSFQPYPIPVLAEPKKIIRALAQLRALKTFASPDAVNTTTGPAKEADIIPDFVPEIGYADDSLIVRTVLERHQELFHDHCH